MKIIKKILISTELQQYLIQRSTHGYGDVEA